MKALLNTALILTLASATAQAQINAGEQAPEPAAPFTMTQVATFNLPWRIAFLPDGRMLVTEKVGPVWLVTQQGAKTPIDNVPAVLHQGQGGMLGVYVSPHYAKDQSVYLTSGAERGQNGIEPGACAGAPGDRCELRQPRGTAGDLAPDAQGPRRTVRRSDRVFSRRVLVPDGRRSPAHDARAGSGSGAGQDPAPDARREARTGESDGGKDRRVKRSLINPPRDTELAKTAPVISTYTFEGPNLTPAETWTTGHRTPYGLAFAPDGRLWEIEHGPRGGDELNLIEPGKNYGWPLVSYATNYNRTPIPHPDTRPDLTKPVIYWTPIIGPGNFIFYNGAMFPQWKGSALIGGMETMTLNRVTFDGKGGAKPPNAGTSATAFATWQPVRTVRCGWSRMPIPVGCSA